MDRPPWPERKPDCLPRAVWQRAKELFHTASEKPEQCAALLRLVDHNADLCKTWRKLARRGFDDDDFRLLANMLEESVPGAGFDLTARERVKQMETKIAAIAAQAEALVSLLNESARFAELHALDYPNELRDASAVSALAEIARDTPARHRNHHDSYTDRRPNHTGIATDWVRRLFYRLPFMLRSKLAGADYARLATAVLGYKVDPKTATAALASLPPERGEVNRLFYWKIEHLWRLGVRIAPDVFDETAKAQAAAKLARAREHNAELISKNRED